MSFQYPVESFKDDIKDFLYSGSYHVTEELAEEARAILSGLDKLKLDDEFLSSSRTWSSEMNRSEVSYEQQVAMALIKQGGLMMREIKNDLNKQTQPLKYDDQLRRDHYNARAKLRAFLESLNPYTYGAYARLENFSHHVGATNRFNGYRNNLSRNHNVGSYNKWKEYADKKSLDKAPDFITPNWRNYTKAFTHHDNSYRPQTANTSPSPNNENNTKSVNTILNTMFQSSQNGIGTSALKNRSLHSAAVTTNNNKENCKKQADKILIERGIIPTYPDNSEYTYSYTKPKESEYISEFIINPQPNMNKFGRPFSSATYDPRFTEYQVKFQAPDGSKLERLPWVKNGNTTKDEQKIK